MHRLNETISVAQTYIKEAVDGNDLTLELKIYRIMDLYQVRNASPLEMCHCQLLSAGCPVSSV